MVSWVVAAALLCAVDALTDGSLSDPGLRNIPVIGDVSSTSGESTSGAQYLDGISWTASSATAGLSIPARVPGDLISDLQLAGKIGDPYFENNFLDASTWNQPDWVYSRKFIPNSDLISAGNKATLVLESVKMGAMVMLNGVHLGNVTDQFVRYSFDVTGRLKPDSAAVLELKFDSEIETHGRFMPCTGGWDWAPWSHTWDQTGAPTFSKGIVGSVYLLPVMQMLLTAVTAHTFYLGQHATVPLEDGHHSGFRVLVTAHLSVVAPEGVCCFVNIYYYFFKANLIGFLLFFLLFFRARRCDHNAESARQLVRQQQQQQQPSHGSDRATFTR
ncbi:unnamed protein product [Polarella glacialis]|uniref:Beta-mannosidase-like galactose-binding domain-containing protein n=1 Tax=Polarella glacialis TaxID=89957 RepID=A0A813EW00_POLGL|nr:unnamed protein product [Polarella glacialis]